MKYLIHDFNTVEKNDFGGKANNLIFLKNNHFNVPNFCVIPYRTLIEVMPDTTNKLDELVEECYNFYHSCVASGAKHVVVRSSANIEDNALFSFAGQFESYLKLGYQIRNSKWNYTMFY